MAEGILTEREWRRQAARTAQGRPRYWGAQCVRRARPLLTRDRRFHAALIVAAFSLALLLPLSVPLKPRPQEYRTLSVEPEAAQQAEVRPVSAVDYNVPLTGEVMKAYRQEELLRGKLLLLDDDHPLPQGAPNPNTMSIAAYGKGMAPVSDLTIKSGKETIAALIRLSSALRGKGASGFVVCRGTMTPLEQREWRLDRMRTLAAGMPLSAAAAQARLETDAPSTGELTQEYTVDIRPASGRLPSGEAYGETKQGAELLQTAWRYGFIPVQHRSPQEIRLRYVGEAHAAAMTYLDLSLEAYLNWLHEKKTLRLKRSDTLSYLILCQPLNDGYVEFQTPQNALCEVSADNTGYAVMACVLDPEAP